MRTISPFLPVSLPPLGSCFAAQLGSPVLVVASVSRGLWSAGPFGASLSHLHPFAPVFFTRRLLPSRRRFARLPPLEGQLAPLGLLQPRARVFCDAGLQVRGLLAAQVLRSFPLRRDRRRAVLQPAAALNPR